MKLFKLNIPAPFVFKRHYILGISLIVCTFIATVLEIVSLGMVVPLFNTVFNEQGPAQSYGGVVDQIIGVLSVIPKEKLFVAMLVLLLVMTVIKICFRLGYQALKRVLELKIQIDCQKLMYEKYIRSDLYFFVHHKMGDLLFRILKLPQEVSVYFQGLPVMVIEAINVGILSAFLMTVSTKLFLCVIALGLVYGLSIHFVSKDFFGKLGAEFPKVTSAQNVIANETVGGIREIIIRGNQAGWIRKFFAKCDHYYRLKVGTSVLRLVPGNVLELLIVAGICVVGIVYGRHNMDKLMTIMPVLLVYVMAFLRMIPSFSNIGSARIQLATYKPSAQLYETLLKEQTIFRQDGPQTFEHFDQEIRFEHITFAYRSGENVLEDFNIVLPKNKTVAIVGGSGSGKTTFIDLLSGLYPVEQGEILIDGKDLMQFNAQSWRDRIGIVSQNSFIFNASVKENIAFDFDEIDMGNVIAAAKLAGAYEFIQGLEKGFETELGDRGYRLSGGQRQRITIARALYRDPEIIIFDEATSALDNLSERIIREMISSLSRKKTILILAHRLSTIRSADIIYVLKDKKVSQSGTHDELLAREGEYRHLYSSESA